MSTNTQTAIQTLGDVLNFMSPFAGGSIPSETDSEYADWVRWIQNKQEEFARRAFWRRCLTREAISLLGTTTLLPLRFNRPNALYMLIVDGVDWMDPNNEDEQSIFVEMENDSTSVNFGRWQMRFKTAITTATSATLWYFSNPPKPTVTTDKLLLPGDMIGYAALGEYFRTANQEGSQDKAEADAENRFQEYLSLEVLPSTNDLLKFSDDAQKVTKTDYLVRARGYYTTRKDRNIQG